MSEPNLHNEAEDDAAARAFPRCWAYFLLVLIAATYRLWVPASQFPAVPLIDLPGDLPGAITWVVLGGLLSALTAVVVDPFRFRAAWWVVLFTLLTFFVSDQHRLQPWAYQTAIYALLFAATPAPLARRLAMPLAISIYCYSGCGKLDYQFAHSVGQQMVETATRLIGVSVNGVNESTRVALALALPASELMAGLMLIWRRTRLVGGILIIAMHGALIMLLGPWGLAHSYGVLGWNALLATQALLLFVRPEWDRRRVAGEPSQGGPTDGVPDEQAAHESGPTPLPSPQRRPITWSAIAALLCLAAALVAPCFERSGYWDHWPSWALYSPHNSRVDVELHRSAIERLDPALAESLRPDEDGDGWRSLDMGGWSLRTLGVPIYPQARYQLGLAREIARRHELSDAIRARLRGTANRWTGVRQERPLLGRRELDRASEEFWLGR